MRRVVGKVIRLRTPWYVGRAHMPRNELAFTLLWERQKARMDDAHDRLMHGLVRGHLTEKDFRPVYGMLSRQHIAIKAGLRRRFGVPEPRQWWDEYPDFLLDEIAGAGR